MGTSQPVPPPGTHYEPKPGWKTTEFIVYVATVIAVTIASLVVDWPESGQSFGARSAWLMITLLSIGYMVSRGLAKSGRWYR